MQNENDAAFATFRARVGGYVVDMIIFGAMAMVVVVIAGFVLLFSTDWAQQDASDSQFYAFLAIIGIGSPLVWSLMNLALLATRGQTGGQYVAGLRLAREDRAPLTPRTVLAWWFCLNPLLFSWPMAAMSGFPLAAVLAIALDEWTVIAFGIIVTLCLLAPVVAFAAALIDPKNRTLYDRIAGTVVVPVP